MLLSENVRRSALAGLCSTSVSSSSVRPKLKCEYRRIVMPKLMVVMPMLLLSDVVLRMVLREESGNKIVRSSIYAFLPRYLHVPCRLLCHCLQTEGIFGKVSRAMLTASYSRPVVATCPESLSSNRASKSSEPWAGMKLLRLMGHS